MYVDFSSLFVKFELYKASFDKYLLEFTSKFLVKTLFEQLFLPHVCIKKFDLSDVWKKRFSTDMKKEFYQAWKYQPPPPSPSPSVIKWLVPKRVVIDHKLRIQ